MSGQLVVPKYERTLWSGAGQFLGGQSLSAGVSGRAPLVEVMDSRESLDSERCVLDRDSILRM